MLIRDGLEGLNCYSARAIDTGGRALTVETAALVGARK
jgi:hypothetical protein